MVPSASRIVRLAIVVGVIGLGLGQYQAGNHGGVQAAGAPGQPTDVLIWQGKLLPIVTDVYTSLGDLGTALTNRDVDGVARVGDEFSNEQQRFETISPVPSRVRKIARIMDQGLRNLANGTKALVVGLRASDNAGSQRAANQIAQGDKQFQQAVDQIRRASGPVTPINPNPSASGTPVPTPIIKGLP
jgi:hypothetical protein